MVYKDGHKENISYPKLLMEEKLGRKLLPNEQVHHIDENPLNNNLDNLELTTLGEHQRMHSKNIEYEETCIWCGKKFIVNKKRHRNHRKGKEYCCGRICSGKYGAYKRKLNENK